MHFFIHIVLEVYQFARDAAVAEAWLIAHEPYLSSADFGVCYSLMMIAVQKLQQGYLLARTRQTALLAYVVASFLVLHIIHVN